MTGARALTLMGPGRLELREYPLPSELEPGAVLVRMLASGICGTDKHTFRGETEQYVGTDLARSTPFPIIQGHENVGVVAAVGDGGARASDGTQLVVGDRIVPAPNRACGFCHMCARGFPYYLCRSLENYGNSLSAADPPHLFGGWSEYLYLKPGTAVFRVPEGLANEVAALTEVFAVTHSLERAAMMPRPNGFRPGDSVAVIGVGPLGLAHAIKASLMGAGQVLAVDRSRRRLATASELIGAEGFADDAEARQAVRDRCLGEGADVVIDATGYPDSFPTALSVVRDGGTVIEVGAFVDAGEQRINPATICGRSLAIVGVGGEDLLAYEGTLALFERHRSSVDFAGIVSHRFGLDHAEEAMTIALDAEQSLKVLIMPGVS